MLMRLRQWTAGVPLQHTALFANSETGQITGGLVLRRRLLGWRRRGPRRAGRRQRRDVVGDCNRVDLPTDGQSCLRPTPGPARSRRCATSRRWHCAIDFDLLPRPQAADDRIGPARPAAHVGVSVRHGARGGRRFGRRGRGRLHGGCRCSSRLGGRFRGRRLRRRRRGCRRVGAACRSARQRGRKVRHQLRAADAHGLCQVCQRPDFVRRRPAPRSVSARVTSSWPGFAELSSSRRRLRLRQVSRANSARSLSGWLRGRRGMRYWAWRSGRTLRSGRPGRV